MRFKTGILAALLSLPILLCPFSRAFAVTATSNNFEFIEAAATESGLSTGDLIATMVANLTAVTGVGFVNGGLEGASIALGNSAADNLNALADAADYPAYSSLSSETQQSWGSQQNYDAAKFNSLMTAFGLGSDLDGFRSSGGANFEWTEDAKDKLDTIGSIGRNWISGAGNTVSSLFDAVVNRNAAIQYVGSTEYVTFNAEDYENWPSGTPSSVNVYKGISCRMYAGVTSGVRHLVVTTDADVYYLPYSYQNSNRTNMVCLVFEKQSFAYGSAQVENADPVPSSNASSYTSDGRQYFMAYPQTFGYGYSSVFSTMPVTTIEASQAGNMSKLVPIILFTDKLDEIGEYETIADYPEELQPDSEEEIYFPSGGITPLINWENFTTEPSTPGTVDLSEIIRLLKQFKFYATGQLKVHDEGVYDGLGDLGTILTGIDATLKQVLAKIGLGTDTSQVIGDFDFPEFDEKATDLVDTISDLAPFGSLLLISAVVDMAAATGSIQDPSLIVPFQFMPGEEYSVTLDFSWLDPLKPVINALLIMVLIMTLASVTLRFVELEAAS